MPKQNTKSGETRAGIEVRPEDVLTRDEAALLAQAQHGKLPCPWCEQPLSGEFAFQLLKSGHFYAGVKLVSLCGFVEY